MHSPECKVSTDVQVFMKSYAERNGIKYSERITNISLSTFLNKIKFIYVPAIKDERVFRETLNILQQSLFDSKNKQILDTPIGEANKAVQNIVGELQTDFETAIPVPHGRQETDQISIEHYFTDTEIKTEYNGKRLFMGNEFYPTGVFIGDEELYYKGATTVAGTIKIIEHESKNM